jgi:hypothetical protein
MPVEMPPIDPSVLENASRVLRDDSIDTALAAVARKSLSARFWSKERAGERLIESLISWAMQPTQENADAAMGCLATFSEKNDDSAHQQLIANLSRLIEENHGFMWNQMIFFALNLPRATQRATAALNLSILYPPTSADPLSGPRFIANSAAEDRFSPEQRASLFAGVLHLGDPRTMGFLLGIWKLLPEKVRHEVATIQPGAAQIPYIEFLLDALACESVGDIYGALAGQLGRLSYFGSSSSPFVTIERAFPCYEGKSGPFLSRQVFSRRVVYEKIRNRLIALKNAEKGAPVMPEVIKSWEQAGASSN